MADKTDRSDRFVSTEGDFRVVSGGDDLDEKLAALGLTKDEETDTTVTFLGPKGAAAMRDRLA